MALFGRGNDLDGILKRIATRSYRGPAEKRELIDQLGQFQLRSDDVVKFLTGGDSDLARFAMTQVATIKDKKFAERLVAAMPTAARTRWKAIVTAALQVDSLSAIERAGQMLRQPRPEAREAAFEVIAATDAWKRQLGLLRLMLRDDLKALQQRALQLLMSDLQDETLRVLVRDLLYDADEDMRDMAIEALARRPHVDFLEDFFDLLPNVDARLQQSILRGLKMLLSRGGISDTVLERILPLLAAEDERIRVASAQLLASMPDSHHVLRQFCRYAKGIAFWLRDRAFKAVSTVAGDIVESILKLLADDDLDVVVGGISLASDCDDPRLVDGLATLIERDEHDWWVKVPAMERLCAFEHPRIQSVLTSRLEDPELRAAALSCLGSRGANSALSIILPYLEHPTRSTRRAAIRALTNYGPVPLVMAALEKTARTDVDYDCQAYALDLLDTFGADGVALAASIRGQQVVVAENEVGRQPLELSMVNPELVD